MLQKIDFAIANFDHLRAAIEAAGYTIVNESAGYLQFRSATGQYGVFRNGTFSVPRGWDVDAIKREYSQQIVRAAAAKYNWKIQGAGGKIQLKRRAF